ncbi:hypothetical protein [Mycobacterium sp. AZCC_0083]|uniref:hypothetical protein n=1 Tax=Mycobacterium sp. AZCC_0083 TaxID=2735882 RepID=UPI00160B0136|nr:hypothetical protein [Mycobacterium sp. AZCC_0083]MBB5162488.1 hypothetical protein [Mycobacterium sp. AZCC_0083]
MNRHTEGINSAPLTHLPDDTIRTHGPVKLMLGPAPGRTISVGLLIDAQPPLGTVEIYLTGHQLQDLADQLNSLLNLSIEEIQALIDRLNTGEAA